MQEIKCPKCGEFFLIDESGYAEIVKQVRDKEFRREIDEQKTQLAEKVAAAVEQTRLQAAAEQQAALRQKEDEIRALQLAQQQQQLRHQSELEAAKASGSEQLHDRDLQLQELKNRLLAAERDAERDKELALSQANFAKQQALQAQQQQLAELQNKLALQQAENRLALQNLEDRHRLQLQEKDATIAQYKDFKVRLSTKMVGESLEQHCEAEFNKIRMAGFQNAYFEKDNDARTGSKGDYIYREKDADGTEFISIMFEMKNEMETTATKKKNADFLKELDKDRREKNCEYAVLVSMLEPDSELYSAGIVDVSYQYPKMYVIRPQFFIPIITLLRNAAQNALQYKKDLEQLRRQEIDLTHFEENMNTFKEGFARNYRLASERFQTAIEEIDKSIDHLQKIKTNLLASENNLRLANDKADALSIKRLTKDSPSIRQKFDQLAEQRPAPALPK